GILGQEAGVVQRVVPGPQDVLKVRHRSLERELHQFDCGPSELAEGRRLPEVDWLAKVQELVVARIGEVEEGSGAIEPRPGLDRARDVINDEADVVDVQLLKPRNDGLHLSSLRVRYYMHRVSWAQAGAQG